MVEPAKMQEYLKPLVVIEQPESVAVIKKSEEK